MEAYSDITRHSDALSAFAGSAGPVVHVGFVGPVAFPGAHDVYETIPHVGVAPLDQVHVWLIDASALALAAGSTTAEANTPDMLGPVCISTVAQTDAFDVLLSFTEPVQGAIYFAYVIHSGVTF